jgi:predicted amidohydrolase YtcJ
MVNLLIRAGAIYSMAPDRAVYRTIAIQNDRILALSASIKSFEDAGQAPHVIDDPSLIVLPAFIDTHNHLLEAARNGMLLPAQGAGSLADFLELIRRRAAITPKDSWIQTSNSWHEQNLREKRLPTALELDQATSDHPVLVRRGGHMAVANSLALKISGLNSNTPDSPGGKLGRFPDGSLNGMLEGGAQYQFIHVPPPPMEEQVSALEESCRTFNAAGIGTLRDPVVSPEGTRIYQAAADGGRLSLRCHPMLLVSPTGSVADRIERINEFGIRSGSGDDRLRVWGLKFVLDGGPEGGALDEPYATDASFRGHLNWSPDEMFTVMNAAVKNGWRIGTHAIGDRAVRTLLDVYERVLSSNSALPGGTLVIEHAFLAEKAQRARAIKMGVAITVQHALLYALADSLVKLWGPERTRQVMPVKSWIEEGAQVSAGTDYPISFFEPIQTIWGMVTRQTAGGGVQGPEHAVDRYAALELSTVAGARLLCQAGRLGSLESGKLADIVAFRSDPLTCPLAQLRDLKPVFTMVGGRAVHDPDNMLGQAR